MTVYKKPEVKKEIRKIREKRKKKDINRQKKKQDSRFKLDLALGNMGNGDGINVNGNEPFEYELHQVDTPPTLMSTNVGLKYPKRALNSEIEGISILTWVVDENGNPIKITVIKEAPQDYGFAKASIDLVNKYRFKPAMIEGVPVRVKVKQPFKFELK
ncbi:MAG: energy transducer TonB [Pseudomonadota bacterium]